LLLEEDLRVELGALNEKGGSLLDWRALRQVSVGSSVDASTRGTLRNSAAGRKLLRQFDRALSRHAKKRASVFLAHSFHKRDAALVTALRAELRKKHLDIVRGEKPAPKSVSAKVLDRIDSTGVFVALFTASPRTGRPSAWVVSELGYAARKLRVVLLERPLEESEIGGIQGDIEYIRFARATVGSAFKLAAQSAAGSGS
jgi:hypothetical protein